MSVESLASSSVRRHSGVGRARSWVIQLPPGGLAYPSPKLSAKQWYPEQFCRGYVLQIFCRLESENIELLKEPRVLVQI